MWVVTSHYKILGTQTHNFWNEESVVSAMQTLLAIDVPFEVEKVED